VVPVNKSRLLERDDELTCLAVEGCVAVENIAVQLATLPCSRQLLTLSVCSCFQLTDVTPFVKMDDLQEIVLPGCFRLDSIESLVQLKQIEHFCAGLSGVKDVSAFERLSCIEIDMFEPAELARPSFAWILGQKLKTDSKQSCGDRINTFSSISHCLRCGRCESSEEIAFLAAVQSRRSATRVSTTMETSEWLAAIAETRF